MVRTIGNPLSFVAQLFERGGEQVGHAAQDLRGDDLAPIDIRTITVDDLRHSLRKGAEDFAAMRTDVIFIVVIYPIIGVLLAWFAFNRDLLPLLFPMVAGFALLGPAAAVGLYEMSRRRERGEDASWRDAFMVVNSPSFVQIVVMGGYLFAVFILWMVVAFALYTLTLGPEPPSSIGGFIGDIFTTAAGWAMLVFGVALGFVLAALVLTISVVSFPLLLDRHVGIPKAVLTSIRVARANPVTVATWGAIVAGALVLGIATFFVGLIFVLPILGHATWHLYRAAVVPLPPQEAS